MTFSKRFPRDVSGSAYPQWEEIFLTDEEENEAELKARKEHILLMKKCLDDADRILKSKKLKFSQSDLTRLALGLFEKRSSHVVYYKERKAKEKFDQLFRGS
jgi:hypothetical protein